MKSQVAQALLEIDAVGFSPDAPIRFKSGILSPVYVDNRRLPYHPVQWHNVIDAFTQIIMNHTMSYDVLAGVAVGGIPHSAALAYELEVPSVFVRKASKEHGKQQQVEGGDVTRKRVLLIEDLITTGSSSLEAVASLRASGAIVEHVCAIVSYGFSEAQANFAQADLTLHTLTDFPTILEVARAHNRFDDDQASIIADWFTDPHNWANRQGF